MSFIFAGSSEVIHCLSRHLFWNVFVYINSNSIQKWKKEYKSWPATLKDVIWGANSGSPGHIYVQYAFTSYEIDGKDKKDSHFYNMRAVTSSDNSRESWLSLLSLLCEV